MIPTGMNPMGLEDRTLTFSVLDNNNSVFNTSSNNRLYTWASFPKTLKDYLLSQYDVAADDVLLSITRCDTQESWAAVQKYASKEKAGTHFMVHGR